MKFSLALAFTLLGVASAATPQRKRSDNKAPSSRRLKEEDHDHDHDHDHEDETHLGIEDAMVASMSMPMSMPMSMGTEDPAEVATRSTSSATGIAVSGVVSAACALGAYAIA
mmetsp:Transcript_16976/g.35539  ORF Transcript_16976/g.35539 Transcript_16976/m.35539 type:complete len:112 (+) Transcript_16976:121-456(+)